MNYRDIIKNQKLRRKILALLCFIPDSVMLRLQYRLQLNRKLDLNNPQRYTEKIQYYKIHYKNPVLTKCVDKYEVREYIKSHGYSDCLIKCYGVFTKIDQIDFEEFPRSFVLKDTLGGGGNSVIIIPDKKLMDEGVVKGQISEWLNRPHKKKTDGREWPYYNGLPHRIIAEEYIDARGNGLIDYKFFCFNGEIACIYVIGNRVLGGHGELAIMDKEFRRLPYQSATQAVMKEDPQKPKNFDLMVKMAETLSESFPHVRVDLYNVEGKVIFGELTFFGASGYQKFEPDEFDYILGEKFDISNLETQHCN